MNRPQITHSFGLLVHASLSALVMLSACTRDGGDDQADQADDASEGGELQAFPACDTPIELADPNPAYPWTPLAVELISEELSPGVFAVYDANADEYGPAGFPLATSGGFVIGSEGVLLVETMINRQLLCQMIRLVQAETDLPVLYAINTSYHGDHSFGNAFLPDEVEIVQHQGTAAHIAANFPADVEFMVANFGAGQGIEEVSAVVADVVVDDTGWTVDLGGITVEARYHGFGQTEGDLFVYVPAAEVLWTGNPLVAEPPAIPWLLDGHVHEVGETLAAVQASLPSSAIVIPGHDRPVGADVFDFDIDYLQALESEVQVAVDAGLSVEETLAQVTLDEFQGYALWDWVHGVINVPTAYAEATH